MAVVLSMAERSSAPRGLRDKTVTSLPTSAEIIILPCIRRERLETPSHDDDPVPAACHG
ncbi:hypothetical protein [Mangrovicella endophytica]|uniref:hypothetical protein n=1 Tax=Mangrovicella endophytica TaxID=2066697 RepID=UPI0013000166|nr:hypothetical protein [Mangrovicella endophytica]